MKVVKALTSPKDQYYPLVCDIHRYLIFLIMEHTSWEILVGKALKIDALANPLN